MFVSVDLGPRVGVPTWYHLQEMCACAPVRLTAHGEAVQVAGRLVWYGLLHFRVHEKPWPDYEGPTLISQAGAAKCNNLYCWAVPVMLTGTA